jgi:hypothetical protein
VNLDDAVALFDAYLDAEWAATTADLSEPQSDVVMARVTEANAFLRSVPGASMGVPIGRYAPVTDDDMAERRAELAQYARRPLFLVAEHDNALWGRLFAGYAGTTMTYTATMYGRLYYAADTDDGPRIVSEYDEQPFSEPVQWRRVGGITVDNPGPVLAVRPIAEPGWPAHLVHWRSLVEEER